jgi:hypothetical protein
MLDEVALLAALGSGDRDLPPALGRKGVGQKRLLFERMRDEDEARAGLVVVELREEGAQHLRFAQGRVRLGEIGPVAPVLSRAEEEYLDAALPAFLMDREDVGFLDALRIDPLVALHMAERGEAVAVYGRALEVEVVGRIPHRRRDMAFHVARSSRQEAARLVDQFCVAGGVDFPGARARAALDLVEKARPRAALEYRIRATPDEEGALQRVDRATYRAG